MSVQVLKQTFTVKQYHKGREAKIPLYADDNIVEVWLVDINGQCVEVYREPTPKGYQNVQQFRSGQSLSIRAFPDVTVTVDEILGLSVKSLLILKGFSVPVD